MMKMLKFAASMAMAIVLMSCGCSKDKSSDAEKEAAGSVGSAKEVAESFVKAIVQGNVDTAFAAYSTFDFDRGRPRKRSNEGTVELKKKLEDYYKWEINDNKLEVKAIKEVIKGGPRYIIVDGQKFTAQATVTVQFIKDKDKKSKGIEVQLIGGDETWKVIDCKMLSDLDTSDDEKKVAPLAHSNARTRMKTVAYATNSAKALPYPKKADYGTSSKVREFENICRELVAEAKKAGKTLDEGEMREEIEKFRKLSSDEQDKQLREGREMLNMLRAVKDLK